MQSTPARKPSGRLKIKVEQATCDQCRLNKVQCLAPESAEEKCKQCEASGISCTWVIGPRPLGRSPPSPSFVAYLENRVGLLERKLRDILPGINLNRELETLAQLPVLPPPQPAFTHLPPTTPTSQSSPLATTPFEHVPTQDEPPVLHSAPQLLKQVRQVSLPSGSKYVPDFKSDTYWSATSSTKVDEPRYHGMSSGEILLRDAKELRREFIPSAGSGKILRRRQQFWEPPAPEKRCRDAELEPVQLPPEDLIRSLVQVFFRRVNLIYPILHRGLFEDQLAHGAHLTSDTTGRKFARVLLLVCAVASRWSSDPRVLTDNEPLSAGYEFFRRAGPVTWAVRAQPSLYDVQICILSALFIHGTSSHYAGWIILGIGIRLAQDIGAHRKKDKVTIESELSKRVFWSLLALDRMMCGALGRPSAMQDLDSDLGPIIELDDEDWSTDGDLFQPLSTHCRLSYFNGLVGLIRILGRAIQTLYALDRTKRQMGLIGPEKEGELLADLQRHLEQWKSTVPDHLKLTTSMSLPDIFFDQAISLWSTYYHIDITIHREFITKKSELTASCLDRCRRSARECARILELHLQAEGSLPILHTVQAAFSIGMVLVFDILAGEKAARNPNNPWASTEDYPKSEKEADVERCRAVLERAESRWYLAGRWRDILRGNQAPKPTGFTFTFSPHHGPDYGSELASGMVSGAPTAAQAPFAATHNAFIPSYNASPNPPPAVYTQSAYLPDAYYGSNTNVPFPGFVSQFNFAPNQGRDDESQWERQASGSQWQQFVNNPYQGGMGHQPW
ncbi:hypothetical protein OPQ81_005247 [Rhizoctonia solani]|nr:hypothetical protein OPQ81_005247 [Rhizoctonia solani]